MKSLILTMLVGLIVTMVCVHGTPAGDKMTRATTNNCDFFCTQDYTPVCATDGDKMYMTFGNRCYLEKYNCEHNTKLFVKFEGECPKTCN